MYSKFISYGHQAEFECEYTLGDFYAHKSLSIT